MFTKKFLGCVPLRTGNIVLAYAGIVISVLVLSISIHVSQQWGMIYEHYKDLIYSQPGDRDEKNREMMRVSMDVAIQMAVASAYQIIFGFFMIFSIILAIGAQDKHRGCIKAYFIYGIIHTMFCLGLGIVHLLMEGFILGGLFLTIQFVYVFCMCGVKGLYNSVQDGKIYSVRI